MSAISFPDTVVLNASHCAVDGQQEFVGSYSSQECHVFGTNYSHIYKGCSENRCVLVRPERELPTIGKP